MSFQTEDRDRHGRFAKGNPGRPPKPTPEQRLEQLLRRHANDLLDAAFREALAGDNAVLASLLNFLAATMGDGLRAAALAGLPAETASH